MSQPNKNAANTPEQLAAELARLTERLTAIETLLSQKMPGFEQVGSRVAELSTAFQEANGRLAALEERVSTMETEEPPPAEQRLDKIEERIEALGSRIERVESTGNRRGGLSRRLGRIEEALERIEGHTGGTE